MNKAFHIELGHSVHHQQNYHLSFSACPALGIFPENCGVKKLSCIHTSVFPNQLLRGDHNQRRSPSGAPHEHLGIIRIGFAHGIVGNGFHLGEDFGLVLVKRPNQPGPGAQRHCGINGDVHFHSPFDGLQQDLLACANVERHQPCGEALVTSDVREHWRVVLAHWHRPRHTWIEVVIHADDEAWRFGCRAWDGYCLGGVAVPRVAHTVRVADRAHHAVPQLRELPARPKRKRR